jgi:hypothetical protein
MSKRSWRDFIPPHPAADLFPMMTREELIALGEDIRKNGLGLGPILWEAEKGAPRQLLDGRNRLDAMEAVGLPVLDSKGDWLVDDVAWKCSTIRGDDPYAIALSMNIHRRHLTAEQKRDLIAEVLKATPGKSNRQIAEQVKADDKTVGKVRRELEATAEIPQLETTIGKDGKARKQQPVVKKKRRDVDDYLADRRAKKITETTAVLPTESERQFAVLTSLWGMNNTLRAAWERSNQKAQRRFIRWLDGGALDEDENEVAGAA